MIFEHDPLAIRLDHFLAQRNEQLSVDERLDLMRRIAEAIHVRDAAEARALIEKDISWGIEYFNELAEG